MICLEKVDDSTALACQTRIMSDSPSGSRIISEPGRRSGKAIVSGTRIAVSDVLSMMAAGMSVDEILADFPELEKADVSACLSHAAALEGMTHEAGRAA